MIQLDEWKNYQGLGKKPANFDTFWETQLKKMEETGLDYELVPFDLASSVADAYHLYFTGVGGAKVHCQLLLPKNKKGKHKGLIQFHGYHTNSGDWQDKIGWVAEGFVVLAMDARGQGGLSEDNSQTAGTVTKGLIIRGVEEGPENLYYVRVFLDTAKATKILMSLEEVDEENIYAQGASQGGGLTIACAALVPEIKKVIATYPFLSDYRKAYQMGAQTSAFEEIPYWFQFRDPLHEQEEEFFNTLEYIDIQHLAPRIQADVYWLMGLQDTIVPPETQLATYNKILSQKSLYTLPEYGHEYLPKISDQLRHVFLD
ncbi:acetylesterase [Enterococcus sp. JM4C]|uniref:acetylxylan esterase n=1 Tax=Candidatus Enterococcus huntleyi TaxID=1857217 RepID=UPI0013796C8A|nr:acetylxylan esterase [Enterococcus sp. JM4C]KAF1296414.1 acetylesterase [Enterococcus sp. JM4C]